MAGPVNSLADFRTIFSIDTPSAPENESSFELLAAGRMSSLVAFDGATWVDVQAGPVSDLTGVWVSESDVAIFTAPGGLLLEYRDGRFGLVESGIDTDLLAVDNGVAVGTEGTVVVLDTNGPDGEWTVEQIVSSTVEDLVDVFADSDGWVMAGSDGSVFAMDSVEMTPRFVRQVAGKLTSVVRTPDGIFVGGEKGMVAILPVNSGEDAGFEDVISFTQSGIRDIAPMDDGRVLAVGDNGIMLACDTQKCERLAESPASFLYGVASIRTDGESRYVAVGWAGEMFVYDGESVQKIDSGTWNVFLAADAGPGFGGRLFIAGRNGTAALLGL